LDWHGLIKQTISARSRLSLATHFDSYPDRSSDYARTACDWPKIFERVVTTKIVLNFRSFLSTGAFRKSLFSKTFWDAGLFATSPFKRFRSLPLRLGNSANWSTAQRDLNFSSTWWFFSIIRVYWNTLLYLAKTTAQNFPLYLSARCLSFVAQQNYGTWRMREHLPTEILHRSYPRKVNHHIATLRFMTLRTRCFLRLDLHMCEQPSRSHPTGLRFPEETLQDPQIDIWSTVMSSSPIENFLATVLNQLWNEDVDLTLTSF